MWNDDWRDELQKDYYDCYIRLCECRNTKKDLKILTKLLYKYNSSKTKEECVDRIISWVTDWNNQVNLVPDEDEYNKLVECL